MEYTFRVVKFGENDFGFFPIQDEETSELWDEMKKFFKGIDKKLKCTTGLMSHIRTFNYSGMLFWSNEISDYVHETNDSPKTFKFVIEDDKFIKSPYARK